MLEAIKKRRSVRSYTDESLDREILEDFVRSGMQAPSAANGKPWEFITVLEKASLKALAEVHPYAKMNLKAAGAIVVVAEPQRSPFPQYFAQDCAAAVENILLEASEQGWGSVWQGIHPEKEREEKLRGIFNIPEDRIPFAVITFGKPARETTTADRYEADRIHREKWS